MFIKCLFLFFLFSYLCCKDSKKVLRMKYFVEKVLKKAVFIAIITLLSSALSGAFTVKTVCDVCST